MSSGTHVEGQTFAHPGRGGRPRPPPQGPAGGRPAPKGRQVDPQALDEVRALLGDRPRHRDLLIEHLHLIQDAHHQISAAHLAALADDMRIPRAGVPAVVDAIARGDTHPHIADYIGYDAYVAGGGYRLLERLRDGAMSV